MSDIQETDPPFKLGQRVRVKPPLDGRQGWGDWRDDWLRDDVPLYVIGIAFDRASKLNIHLSTDWPGDGGFDDVSADILEAV